MQETWVRFLGREDPLEKEMATHSSILAWNPMDRGAWQATVHGVTRVGHDLATKWPPPPHYNTIQSSFTALKPLWVLPIHLHFPFNTWQPRMFLCAHSFAFPRMSYSWNRTSVAFSAWLLSLQNIPLHFMHVFSRLDSSCLIRIE